PSLYTFWMMRAAHFSHTVAALAFAIPVTAAVGSLPPPNTESSTAGRVTELSEPLVIVQVPPDKLTGPAARPIPPKKLTGAPAHPVLARMPSVSVEPKTAVLGQRVIVSYRIESTGIKPALAGYISVTFMGQPVKAIDSQDSD